MELARREIQIKRFAHYFKCELANFLVYLRVLLDRVKNKIKYLLQKLLGFKTYLYVFAIFKIRTLKSDSKEKDFFHFLSLIKDKKGLILDIGANIGIMSYHLSKNFPNTKIHAFEPIPQNLSVLKKVISKFHLNNVDIHDIALGEKEEKVQMILPRENKVLFQGLSHVKHESITEMNEGIEINVEMNTLDNVFNGELIQAIKIDVENFEYFVLKGGKRIIENNKPIIYAELWKNENRENCFTYLKALNYVTYVVENNKLISFDKATHTHQNFIFKAN